MRKIMLFVPFAALAITACRHAVSDAIADVKTTVKST
ncbi:MAG: hypothetical protein RL209_1611 [Pseudomonadota bacterium]|jgi:hypothetical protein